MPQYPYIFSLPARVTPRALATATIATGGTAVVVIVGPCNGGFISNPPNAASQNIALAENLYLDMTKAPGSTDATGNGTTSILMPGQSFTIPALAVGAKVQVNAATSGHLIAGEVW